MTCIVFLTLALQSVLGQTCRPELYIPFTGDASDQSGNNYNVSNRNVLIQNGMGVFNKTNMSYLNIPDVKLQAVRTLVIKVVYRSTLPLEYTGNLFSIIPFEGQEKRQILEDNMMILFRQWNNTVDVGIQMSKGDFCQVKVQNDNVDDGHMVTAVATFHERKLSLRVNDTIGYSPNACGLQADIVHPFAIGGPQSIGLLSGYIDEISVYPCIPDL